MNPDDFHAYAAKGYNRVPVTREVLADLDTPLSTYLKLASAPYTYLFESVEGGEKWGRYSFIGLSARTVVRVHDYTVTVSVDDEVTETYEVDDPLAWIESFQARYRAPSIDGLPRFTGGLVGYFGYDTVRYIEQRLGPCPAPDALGVPDILLMVSDEVLAFDNLRGRLSIIVHGDPSEDEAYGRTLARVDQLAGDLATPQLDAERAALTPVVTELDFELTMAPPSSVM